MKRWFDKIGLLTRHFEALLHMGLLCWLSIAQVLRDKTFTWTYYLGPLLLLVLVQLPVLVFAWNKERLRERLSFKRYLLWWVGCFGIYLPAIVFGLSYFVSPAVRFREFVITGALFSLLLELVLVVNAWLRQRVQQWQLARRLSLERSVLISIALISLIFSIMGVSSMGNPAYDSPDRLLLGFEFNVVKVFTHFGVFLGFVLQFLFMYLCGYFYFYVNNRLLVPLVLKPKGMIVYALAGMTVVAVTYPLISQLLLLLPINKRMGGIFESNPFTLENAGGAILIILLSLPVVLAIQWGRQNNRIVSLEKEKAETELDLLKQQLNPHFFFNTLNNLYALSLQQSKQTPDSILQLSELMRYVIYKAKEPTVSLREEVKYLEDYIDLQQIRLKRQPDIQFVQEITGDAPAIAPLLLIVLVENAFKHGVEPAEGTAFVHLWLRVNAGRLYFTCVNSFEQAATDKVGIGLANLQRRLALLYPGKHSLKTEVEKHTFKAELELDLS